MITRIPVTPEMIEALEGHRARTGVSFAKLLQGRRDCPRGLTSTLVDTILRGDCVSIREEYYAYLIGLYARITDAVDVTDDLRRDLAEALHRSGKTIRGLMRLAGAAPPGLTLSRAQRIQRGEIKTAFQAEIDFLRAAISKTERRSGKRHYIPITEDMFNALIAHKERTGMGAIAVYSYMRKNGFLEKKHNLSTDRIAAWLNRLVVGASERDFNLVIQAYESIENKGVRPPNARCNAGRVHLSDNFVNVLRHYFETRLNFSRPLFLKRANAPSSLTHATLNNVLSGKTKSLTHKNYEFLSKLLHEQEE